MTRREDLYPSRGDRPRFLPRLDPVVHGPVDAPGPLGREDLERFEREGFLFLPAWLGAEELRAAQAELERLRRTERESARDEVVLEPGSGEVRSIFAVHEQDGALAALCRSARLVAAVRQILADDVYVHQSRVNYKPGFRGKEFYWHSDFETWHQEDGMPRMRAVSCSVSLTENVPENGPVLVIPGSHRRFLACVGATPENHYKQSLKKQEYGVPDDESLAELAREGGIAGPVGPAGSLLLFDCNAMHGSNSNITPWPRSNVFFVYNAKSNALVEPYCGLAPRPPFIASRDFTPLDVAA
jgi:ectoine hydroxylase